LTSAKNVDCLVCHETTGTYKKFPTGAGNPVSEPKKFKGKTFKPPDWNKIAESVGRPERKNCGSCHFYGGGGDGVKHGDLDSSLYEPSRELDVHMSPDGGDFDCVRCHTTTAHKISGRCYKTPAVKEHKSLIDDEQIDRISCVSCHTLTPHRDGHKANDHTDVVACQSCHIPEFARKNPTKMWWDWSTAGRMSEDGKPYTVKGPYGKNKYNSKKGSFEWETNVVPEYDWFDGGMEYILLPDEINPQDAPIKINHPMGGPDSEDSMIYPFKIHRGKQPYDSVSNEVVNVHLFGSKESGAYWKNFNWEQAIQAGMDYIGRDFSGEYDFVETMYYFPITHMVAPKEDSLQCSSCHSREGRLANISGIYMPGRDKNDLLNIAGWLVVAASICGVTIHGIGRAVSAKRRK
jgi:octaheme c-type cytochrome (tetrathionate reductase family)